MIWIWLLLQLGGPPSLNAADSDAVVDVAQLSQQEGNAPEGWNELEGRLSTAQGDAALDAYLQNHPQGPAASRAYLEKARRSPNLIRSEKWYRAAYDQDPQGAWAKLAVLEAAKQDYVLQRPEEANLLFSKLEDADFDGENLAQLLYWRAQTFLVLKDYEHSQDDFESFLHNFSSHPLADAARLGIADCDFGQGHLEAAMDGYRKLYEGAASSVAPSALMGAAAIDLEDGEREEAKGLFGDVLQRYPSAVEADAAKEALAALPAPSSEAALGAAPAPNPEHTHFSIQVGVFSRRLWAEKLFLQLKRKGYPVHLDRRSYNDSAYDVVLVGSYATKAAAQRAALRLQRKEHCEFVIVETGLKP